MGKIIAHNLTTKKAIYLKKLIKNSLMVPCIEKSIVIMCNNTWTIVVIKDPKYHSKAKHIEEKYHYVRDILKKHEVSIERCQQRIT